VDLNEARRIYASLKPVYDVLGGDLVSGCLEKGVPPSMLHAIMVEWRESESRMNRVMGVLRDDKSSDKRIPDDLMKKFEDLHDDNGELKRRHRARPDGSSGN